MVKKHTKIIAVTSFLFAVCVLIFFLDSKNSKESIFKISYQYKNTDILPTAEIAAMYNSKVSIYMLNSKDGTEKTNGSVITCGNVKDESVKKFAERFNINNNEVMQIFGNMYRFNENTGHDSFVFKNNGQFIITYDDKMITIPSLYKDNNTGVFVSYYDKGCIILEDRQVYSIDFNSMKYKVYNDIEINVNSDDLQYVLTDNTVINSGMTASVCVFSENSIIFLKDYENSVLKKCEIPGKVISLTLNNDKKNLTIISTDADNSRRFSQMSVYNLPIYNSENQENLIAEFKFNLSLPDERQVFIDEKTKSIQNGDIVSVLAESDKVECIEKNIIGINIKTGEIEGIIAAQFLKNVVYFNSGLVY